MAQSWGVTITKPKEYNWLVIIRTANGLLIATRTGYDEHPIEAIMNAIGELQMQPGVQQRMETGARISAEWMP